MEQKSSSFDLLESEVKRWIWKQGWTSLKAIQENSIPFILNGDCDVIISAATAGGKTEAVFLPVLTSIIRDKHTDGYKVLYVSPLKSLINDQSRRLTDMAQGITNITPWHGDVSLSKKKNSLAVPDGILIITPESLESLLMHHHDKIRNAFANLKYVVIDELHTFILTERGKQLQSQMSRIEHIVGRHIPRIAMSATFSDYELVKRFLRQDNSLSCAIPEHGNENHDIKVLIKEYNYGYNEERNANVKIANDIFIRLRGTNNLVFVNNRHDCERFCSLLNDKCLENHVPNEFRIHHGSISKELRTKTEHELQSGKTPITAICTATLELGVDIGKVISIAQIDVAESVSGLRQRLGRSGRRNEASILRIYSKDYNGFNAGLLSQLKSHLIQNIAVIELLKEYKYESPCINGIHLSTLIQQILSIIAEFGSFYPKEGWRLLCEEGAFKNVTVSLFLKLLKDLGEKEVIRQTTNGQIIIGHEGETLLANKEFYAAFNTYPEIEIVNVQNGQHIGCLLNFVEIGFFIVFGGFKWEVVDIDYKANRAYVKPSDFGGLPRFQNDGYEIDSLISRKMKEIYLSDNLYPYLDSKTETVTSILDARKCFQIYNLGENFSQYEDEDIMLTWAGAKINRTICLISKLLLDKSFNYNHIYINGFNKELLIKLLSFSKPKPERLCSLLMRDAKEMNKFDYLLSDELLGIQYASMYLDVDGAWEVLGEIKGTAKDI